MRTFCLRPGKLYSKGKYTDLEYHISFLHSLPVFLYFSPSFSVFFAFYLYILNFPFLSFFPVFFYFSSSLSIFTSWIFLSCPSFLSSSISLLYFCLLRLLSFLPIFFYSCPYIPPSPFLSFLLVLFSSFPSFLSHFQHSHSNK